MKNNGEEILCIDDIKNQLKDRQIIPATLKRAGKKHKSCHLHYLSSVRWHG